MSDLRVLFIPTGNSGLMHWRIQNYVVAVYRNGLASFQNPLWFKDLNGIQPWQEKLTDKPGKPYDPFFIRQFVPMIESGCVNADAVVMQYAHEEGALELFDAIKTKFPHLPILTEIDDNILSVPHYNEAAGTFDPRSEIRKRAIKQMRASDAVIVSTPYLKEIYSEFNGNCYVVPNAIDFKQWDKLKPKARSGIRIGWAGGSGHEGDFAIVQDALKRILAKHKDTRLILVNGPAQQGIPDYFKGVERIEHHATWTPILKYPKMLADMDFDIGIAPVVDSAFNRAKSNLKWLENAALGIPTVAMRVGHYAETMTDGVDSFLCDDEEQFFTALDKLVTDRKLRKRMGAAANAKARQEFNVDKVAAHYVAVLSEVAEKKATNQLLRVGEVMEPA